MKCLTAPKHWPCHLLSCSDSLPSIVSRHPYCKKAMSHQNPSRISTWIGTYVFVRYIIINCPVENKQVSCFQWYCLGIHNILSLRNNYAKRLPVTYRLTLFEMTTDWPVFYILWWQLLVLFKCFLSRMFFPNSLYPISGIPTLRFGFPCARWSCCDARPCQTRNLEYSGRVPGMQ